MSRFMRKNRIHGTCSLKLEKYKKLVILDESE